MSQTVTEFEACKEDVSNKLGGLQAAKIQILDKLCDRPTVGLDSETIRAYYIRPSKTYLCSFTAIYYLGLPHWMIRQVIWADKTICIDRII